MSNLTDAIIRELELFNESIRDTLYGKNITNTGTAKKSLRTEHVSNSYKSIGIFYLEFLDTGRGSGGLPPINKIHNWVKSKLGITDEKQSLSVAYAVAKKIQRLGTEIFKDPSKGINLDAKVKQLKEDLNRKMAEGIKLDIIQKLDKFKNKHLKTEL